MEHRLYTAAASRAVAVGLERIHANSKAESAAPASRLKARHGWLVGAHDKQQKRKMQTSEGMPVLEARIVKYPEGRSTGSR